MGLFDLFKKKDNATDNTVTPSVTNTVAQEAVNTVGMTIDMSKSANNLNKVLIDMSKSSKIDMTKHTARVAFAMDYSGSMDDLYRNKSVQKLITRLLPIALKFDDNGELESWLFSIGKKKLEPVTLENYENYVKDVIYRSNFRMSGTEYSPVLRDMVHYYKDKQPSEIPAFIIFITDGDNSDKYETDAIVREFSKYNMFVQFVGIGTDSFSYLRKLDDLSGRASDNTGFITVRDINRLSDEELYTKLLEQYKAWLNNK